MDRRLLCAEDALTRNQLRSFLSLAAMLRAEECAYCALEPLPALCCGISTFPAQMSLQRQK